MGRATGEERYSEWSFTETLSMDDVELRERQQIDEEGEVCVVPYAYSIQGRETTKITYRGLRKVCSYLGVRYYKNRPKDMMMELIAQKKLKGQVPESYRNKRKAEKVVEREQSWPMDQNENENVENQDTAVTEETHPLFTIAKRQRVATDESNVPTITEITPSASATNAFLQPVSPIESDRRHLPSTEFESGIQTDSVSPNPPRIHMDMSLTDRVDTFNLLRHIRQQIQHIEDEIVAHTASDVARVSNIKTQRLTEDLQFYLAERRSLIQQLEGSR